MTNQISKQRLVMIVLGLILILSNIEAHKNSKGIPLADPFILCSNGMYYAYGTSSQEGFKVYVSKDLEKWTPGDTPLGNHLVLQKGVDVWGRSDFWAPEVYCINNKYYMFYSANTRICVATSLSPLGPFKQEKVQPIIPDEGCIDHHLFIDDNGKFYIFFVRFNDGNNIWMAEISSDLQQIASKETWKHCISVSQPWENKMGRIIEGPFVLKHNGVYYLTYSANDYRSSDYAVGYATTHDLSNLQWKKSPNNPILHRPGKLVGTGHHSFFYDTKGNLKIVFHAHKTNTIIHPREMYISDAQLKNDKLNISSKFKKAIICNTKD